MPTLSQFFKIACLFESEFQKIYLLEIADMFPKIFKKFIWFISSTFYFFFPCKLFY